MADRIEGLTIGLSLDTIKVDTGLQSLKSKLTMVNSEMKNNMSAFDRGEKSVSKYQTQLEGLNKKIEVQKSVTAAAQKNYEKMVKEHGEGSVQAEKAATQYNNQAAALNNLERYVDGVTKEMKEFAEAQKVAESGFTKFGDKMQDVGGKFKSVGTGMKDVGKSMSMYVTAPLVGFGALAAKTGIDFDDSMAKVRATSGATGEDMAKLRDLAKDMGATTKFSASEASEGLNFMAMAGWKTEQMMDGLPGILNLAAASGEDLGTTSDIVTDALTAFGMAAEDSGRLADILAATSSNANTNVSMLGESFKYVAPLAGAMGYSAEDTSIALGLMANSGVKASQAGTTLKTMFANMAKPTKAIGNGMNDLGISLTDSEGNMKSMEEVLQNLRSSFSGLTENQQAAYASQIFGKEAMAGALSVINASTEDYDKLSDAIYNSAGSAEEMAAIMEGELGGVIREIKSGLEGFAISIYEEMLPALSKGAEKVKSFVGWLNDLSPGAKKAAVVVGGIAAAIGPVLVGLGTLAVTLGSVITFVGSASSAIGIMGTGVAAATPLIGGLASIFTVLTGPVGLTIAAIAGVTVGVTALVNHLKKDAIPEVDRFGEGVSKNTKEALGGFFDLSDGASQQLTAMSIKGKAVTQEMADSISGKFSKMNEQILNGMKKRHTDEMAATEKLFAESSALSVTREAEILEQQKQSHIKQEAQQNSLNGKIKKIMDQAAKEKRELTESEKNQINFIQEKMGENAVQYLTDNEREQKVILERMKSEAGKITALQAAEVVKNSKDATDKVIKDAEKKYKDTVAEAIKQRDETKTISKEEAKAIIDDAEAKRKDSIKKAEDMHKGVVKEAKAQAKDHVKEVDWESGEVKSKWEIMKTDVVDKAKKMGSGAKTAVGDMWTGIKKDSADGWAQTKLGWNDLKTNVVEKATSMGSSVKTKYNDMKNSMIQKTAEIKSGLTDGFESAKNNVVNTANKMKERALSIFTDIVSGAKAMPGKMKDGIVSMAGEAVKGIRNVGNKMATMFGSVVNGLIKGLNSVTSKLGVSSSIAEWKVPQYASGTDAHPGGLMVVGDKHGREIVQFPDGRSIISPDKDTLMQAPKGTRVIPNKQTEQFLSGEIPHYAKGTGVKDWVKEKASSFKNALSNIWDHVSNPGKLIEMMGLPSLNSATGGFGTLIKGASSKIREAAVDYVKNMFGKAAPPVSAGGAYSNTGTGPGGAGSGFPGFGYSSGYGWRIHPITGKRKFHNGDDYPAPYGKPIPNQVAGTVVRSEKGAGAEWPRGYFVQVRTGAYDRVYQHNSRNLVSRGQSVKKGQTVGLVGSTGSSTGNHLHYEVWKNGKPINPKGLATGGRVDNPGLFNLTEEGHPEFVIPTAPKRRTDAMKLLALAAQSLGSGDNKGVHRPSSLGGNGGVFEDMVNILLEQNQLLMKLLQKNTDVYLDGEQVGRGVYDTVDGMNYDKTTIAAYMRGVRV